MRLLASVAQMSDVLLWSWLSSEFGQFTATAGSSKFQCMVIELQKAMVMLNWPTRVCVKHKSVV